MRIFGQELSADVIVPDSALRDEEAICRSLRAAAARLGCAVLSEHLQRFEPAGVTAVLIIGESHLLVSTYPELGIASFNIQTCSERLDLVAALETICETLGASLVRSMILLRHLDTPFQVELCREGVPFVAGRLRLESGRPSAGTNRPSPRVADPVM